MNLPEVWMAAPAAHLPGRRIDNAEILRRVRANFPGDDEAWAGVERRIRSLFRICGSQWRYLEEVAPLPLAGHAARAAREALDAVGVAPADVDFLLYGCIAREYYEPATAAEVAALVGANRAMPIDVTTACAGSLVAMQDLVGRMAMDDTIRVGVVTTATLTPGHIRYRLDTPDDVADYGAGLTLGNAATATVLTRTKPPVGGRIVGLLAEGLPEHHGLCRAPVGGHFVSQGVEIFALARHLPGHVQRLCERVGWSRQDVDLFVSHQPSNRVLYELARAMEVDPERIPALHGLFGNTAASAVPLALSHLVKEGRLQPGMKVVLATAASGFVMASFALEWG